MVNDENGPTASVFGETLGQRSLVNVSSGNEEGLLVGEASFIGAAHRTKKLLVKVAEVRDNECSPVAGRCSRIIADKN